MDSRKEVVIRAIGFRGPSRVPVLYWNRDPEQGDIMVYHLSLSREPKSSGAAGLLGWSVNEWGYKLESLDDGTMGYPVNPVYSELPDAAELEIPPLRQSVCQAQPELHVARSASGAVDLAEIERGQRTARWAELRRVGGAESLQTELQVDALAYAQVAAQGAIQIHQTWPAQV